MGKFLKGCLIALGALAVLLLVLAGLAYYLLTRPSPAGKELLPPGATAPTPTPPPQVIEERAQALETKLETFTQQIEEAEKGTQPQLIRLEITEEEVNALITRELPKFKEEMKDSPLVITGATVAFREGKLKALAQAEFSAFKPNIYLEARVVLEEGKPKVIVDKLDLGRFPLPGAAKDQINKFVQDALRQATEQEIPIDIQSLTIEEGKLVLEGMVKPKATPTPPGATPTPVPTAAASPTPPGATPTPAPTAAASPLPPGATPTPTPVATATPTPQPVTLELLPEDVALALTLGLTELQKKEALPLQIGAVQVDLSQGKIVAQVPVTFQGLTFQIPLVAGVAASQGKAQLVVESVDVSTLPPPLNTQVEDFVRRGASGVALDVGFQVTSATIREGKLVLEGLSQP